MSELKSGDLALIIGGDDPEEIGRTVELLILVGADEMYRLPGHSKVTFNISGSDVWIVKGDVSSRFTDGTTYYGFTQKAPFNLMPLRGDFAPEQVRERELTE